MTDSAPRGIRLNNPGNLDRIPGQNWQGMSAVQSDPRELEFETPAYGIRALAILLVNYSTLHNLKSVAEIIGRYAPPNENDTDAYIAFVAQAVGVAKDVPLDLSDRQTLTKLIKAIIAYENSHYAYPADVLDQGIGLALDRFTNRGNPHPHTQA